MISKVSKVLKAFQVKRNQHFFFIIIPICLLSLPSFADSGAEVSYVINTFIILFCAALVMWMAAGFCMLEGGLVRIKNMGVICLKNVTIYSIACLCFYFIGYNLMFTNVSSWIGELKLFADMSAPEFALIGGESSALGSVIEGDYSTIALVLFQTTFVAAGASVVSGALAERVRLWPFFIFCAILTGVIYPIQGSWSWGGGWLGEMGFSDFAGSTVVHSVGGWAALTGAYFLGPRRDKYDEKGEVKNYFPSNVPLVTLGVFILWLGWLGFNGGSLLVFSGAGDMSTMALILMNTNIASAAGAVVTLFLTRILYGRINFLLILNGALAGLVSITAGPDSVTPAHAVLIGSIGAILATLVPPVLDRLRIDDVVGAIPVHLVAGIWGTLAVGLWGNASLSVQIIGVLSVGGFTVVTTIVLWWVLKKLMSLRVSEGHEELGQDLLELGMEVDPEIKIF